MAVSPNTDFTPAAEFVMMAAYQILGIINEDEIPTAGQYKVALYTLNSMMKELEATGIHVWTEEEGIIFLQQSQRRYLLGGTTLDHACDANAWIQTALRTSAAPGSSALTVESTAGMSNGDNFGVVQNDGSSFWSIITGIGGNVVSLAAPTTQATSSQTQCFSYPPAAQLLRPLRVPFSRRLAFFNGIPPAGSAAPDWGGIITSLAPMMARRDFFDLPQPNNPGLVNQVFYDPARDQGEMWVWNCSQNAQYGLRFTYYRPIADFTTQANTADLPQEWNNALTWILAKELAPRYSVPTERFDRITMEATKKYELVSGWDREPESVFFGRSSPQTR